MDDLTFDTLLRKAAQQTTRRETLGTLLGGALLLNNQGQIEATEKAKRRKKQKKQHRQASGDLLTIRVVVRNPGPHGIDVQFVPLIETWTAWRCTEAMQAHIPADGSHEFLTQNARGRSTDGFVWIKGTYAIEFWNPVFRRPAVSAAANGVSMNKRQHCPNRGTRALERTPMDPRSTFTFSIYDKQFNVSRNADTSFKEFTLTLPQNL